MCDESHPHGIGSYESPPKQKGISQNSLLVTFPAPPNHTFIITAEERESFSLAHAILDMSDPYVPGKLRYGVIYTASNAK